LTKALSTPLIFSSTSTSIGSNEKTLDFWTKWLEKMEIQSLYGYFFGLKQQTIHHLDQDSNVNYSIFALFEKDVWIDEIVDKMMSKKTFNKTKEHQKTLAIAQLIIQYMKKIDRKKIKKRITTTMMQSNKKEEILLSAWHSQTVQFQREFVERICGDHLVLFHGQEKEKEKEQQQQQQLEEEEEEEEEEKNQLKKVRNCWMKLFTKGKWSNSNELILYFKEYAYEMFIQSASPEEISQLFCFFLTNVSLNASKQMVGLEIALMIPSTLLSKQDMEFLFQKARMLFFRQEKEMTEQKRRVFGLFVFRFDMKHLLKEEETEEKKEEEETNIKQHKDLEILVANCFEAKQDPTWKQQRKGMFICGLVWAKEIAWAGRLVCFEENVHPSIWHYSYARLMLGNYLKNLIKISTIQIEKLNKTFSSSSSSSFKPTYEMLTYTKILYEKTYEKFMKYQRGQYDDNK
jgi:hypothetical protein